MLQAMLKLKSREILTKQKMVSFFEQSSESAACLQCLA